MREKIINKRTILIIIEIIIVSIITFFALKNAIKLIDKKEIKTGQELIFDEKKNPKGNATAFGVMEDTIAMMIMYSTKTNDKSTVTFTIKNNSKGSLKIDKDNIKINYRKILGEEENTYYVTKEEFNEYFEAKLIYPTKKITLKRNEETKIKVEITSKKLKEEMTTVGGINIMLYS